MFLDEQDEDRRDELREQLQPLCFMKRIELTIQLAWGGPEYGFRLVYDWDSRDWINGVFYFANWFTYDEVPLNPAEMDQVVDAYSADSLVE